MKIIHKLKSPYPLTTDLSYNVKMAIAFTLFIFIISLLTNDISNSNAIQQSLLFCGTMLGVLLINSIFIPPLFPSVFKESNWTVWKQLVFIMFQFLCIGIANYTLFTIMKLVDFRVDAFLKFMMITISSGVTPVIVLVLFEQNRLLKKNLENAAVINQQMKINKENLIVEKSITIKSISTKQEIILLSSQLLAIESMDNYVKVYILRDHKVITEIIRVPLKEVEQQLANEGMFLRCHRSYIVNLNCIENVNGNAQGLKLEIHDIVLPVSRSYIDNFKHRFNKIGQ